MAAQESVIVKAIERMLKKHRVEHGVWWINKHGSAYGRRGVPDIVGCIRGRTFGLEVKRPEVGVVSEIQKYELQQMANAGALVAVVESVEDACSVLGLPR